MKNMNFISGHFRVSFGWAMIILLIFFIPGCQKTKKVEPPVAEKISKELTIHGDTRVDNYYWLNQRDNPKVIEYLEAENAYKDAVLKHTEALQETLFLGLRLTRGVDWEALKAADPERKLSIYGTSLRALSDKRLAEWKGPVVRLTPAGMLVSNEIFQMFV